MKTIKRIIGTFVLSIVLFTFYSCENSGNTDMVLSGNEGNLPDELRGLKVYRVSTEGGNYVKVALLNNNINSITYPVGKLQQSTIIIDKQNQKLIEVKEILLENDSMIVCRK